MATNARLDALTISVGGFLDPSLQKTLADTERKLRDFGASTRTMSETMKRVYSVAFSPPEGIQKSIDQVNKFQSSLGAIKIAGGVTVGGLLVQGMDEAIEKAKEFGDYIKGAVEQAGMFTRTREQLAIELGKSQNDPYTQQIIEQLQKYSFQTHLVPDVLLEAFRQTKSSGFADTEAMKHIQEIANISAATVPHGENASQAFLELMDTYNKAAKGGAALEKTMYMFEKRGVALRGIMAKLVGLDVPENIVNLDPDDPRASSIDTQLAKLIKARKVPFADIGGAITQLGGPGGKYDVMQEFSKDLLGAESTLQGSMAMFTREFGHAFEGPITQLLNSINAWFNWDKFKATQDFLDDFSKKIDGRFREVMPHIDSLGNAMAHLGQSMFGKTDLAGAIDIVATNTAKFADSLTILINVFNKIKGWYNFLPPWLKPTLPDLGQWNTKNPMANPAVTSGMDALGNIITPRVTEAHDKLIKSQGAQSDAAQTAARALSNLQGAVDKTTGNDFFHLNLAVDASTQKLLDFASAFSAGGFQFGNFPLPGTGGGGYSSSPIGSTSNWTQFGGGVVGDRPGEKYWDPDSWAGRGAYGHLKAGDVAMHPQFARSHYHIEPGQIYRSDKDGQLHRWQDKSGSKAFDNEDVYKPQSSNINYSPTYHIQVLDASGVHKVLQDHGEMIHEHLTRLAESDWSRSAVV
jgi:hypothetical protein